MDTKEHESGRIKRLRLVPSSSRKPIETPNASDYPNNGFFTADDAAEKTGYAEIGIE
jgi:hypothetical protein